MARPVKCRRIRCAPATRYFKPQGIPLRNLEEIVLGLDELEAMRLADLEGLYQAEAAAQMGVSRQTISLIERGDYSPSVTLALKIAKICQVTVEDIFEYKEDENDEE